MIIENLSGQKLFLKRYIRFCEQPNGKYKDT